MSEDEEEKLLSRYILVKEGSLREAVTKIVVAFLLTTICGGVFTSYLSRKDKNREITQRQFNIKSEFFKEVSGDIDRRYFCAFRCISSYKLDEPYDKQKKLYDDYQESVVLWNTHRMKNLGLMSVHFSPKVTEAFNELHKAFGDQLHDTLRTSINTKHLFKENWKDNPSEEESKLRSDGRRILINYYPKALQLSLIHI